MIHNAAFARTTGRGQQHMFVANFLPKLVDKRLTKPKVLGGTSEPV